MSTELYMEDDTEPVDVLEFAVSRLENPTVFEGEGIVVFNFHNRSLDAQPLSQWAQEAAPGVYVVPYQVGGVWTFIHGALPPAVARADFLAYRGSEDAYVDYPNWWRPLQNPNAEFAEADAVRTLRDIGERAVREVLMDVD